MRFLDLTKPHCYSAWGRSIGNLNLLTLSPLNFPTPSAIRTSFQVPRQSRSKHSSGICPFLLVLISIKDEQPFFRRFSTFSKLTASVVAGDGGSKPHRAATGRLEGGGGETQQFGFPRCNLSRWTWHGRSTTQYAALSRSHLARGSSKKFGFCHQISLGLGVLGRSSSAGLRCLRAFGEPRKAKALGTLSLGPRRVQALHRQAVKCLKVSLPSLPDPSPAQGPSLL